jgi:nucleotide-binding universal stress UspA family protein
MTLVVGYDGGESSRNALAIAIGLASDLREDLVVVTGVGPGSSVGEEYRATEEAVVEALAPETDEAVSLAQEAGVAAEALLVDASPVEALLTAVELKSARMIIVGYGASGRIRAALLGAVAPRMLEESHIPVLVVP